MKKSIKMNSYIIINWIFRIFILISFIIFLLQKDFQKVGYLGVTFLLTFYDKLVEKGLKIELKTPLKFSILFLIFAAQCLGSVYEYYGRFIWWDTVVHAISGVIFFYVGLTFIEQVNQKLTKTQLHPMIKIIFAICFSLSIGVLWEFFEFTVDKFFGGNMQTAKNLYGQDAIWDTMQDLLAATIGTGVATIIESITIKKLKNRKGEENNE